MTQIKSTTSVLDRLSNLEYIFQDLRSAVIRAGSSAASFVASSDARASLIVGSRALNLFISNFVISERLEPQLLQLNSYMIRLSSDGPDCQIAYTKLVNLLDQVLQDIDNFRHSFAPDAARKELPLSSQVDSESVSDWVADDDVDPTISDFSEE